MVAPSPSTHCIALHCTALAQFHCQHLPACSQDRRLHRLQLLIRSPPTTPACALIATGGGGLLHSAGICPRLAAGPDVWNDCSVHQQGHELTSVLHCWRWRWRWMCGQPRHTWQAIPTCTQSARSHAVPNAPHAVHDFVPARRPPLSPPTDSARSLASSRWASSSSPRPWRWRRCRFCRKVRGSPAMHAHTGERSGA